MNLAWDWKVRDDVCFVCANDEGWNEGWFALKGVVSVNVEDPYWIDKRKPTVVIPTPEGEELCLCQKHLAEAALALREATKARKKPKSA